MNPNERSTLGAVARAAAACLAAPPADLAAARSALCDALDALARSVEASAPLTPDVPVTVDYRILFCEHLTRLTDDEVRWIERHLRPCDEWEQFVATRGHDAAPEFSALHALYARGDAFPEFEWRLEGAPDARRSLVMYSEAFSNADHVAAFVQAFLAAWRPHEHFTLGWAETCSALRPGAFGGGGFFVTATRVECIGTAQWFDERQSPSPEITATPPDEPT